MLSYYKLLNISKDQPGKYKRKISRYFNIDIEYTVECNNIVVNKWCCFIEEVFNL